MPDLERQLTRIGAVLIDVVAPAVADHYARDVLLGLANALRQLGPAAVAMPAFLAWDEQAAADLLAAARLAGGRRADAEPDPAGLAERNRAVRAALESAAPAIAADAATSAAFRSYARERLSRDPYRG